MSNQLTLLGTQVPATTSLSEPIKAAIREVLVAFPSANVSTEERTIQLGTYRDAVLGFEEELVVSVLKWLRFNNPRNTPTYTQPPTAQDVHDAVVKRRKDWATKSKGYFIGYVRWAPEVQWCRGIEELPCSRPLAEKLLLDAFDRDEAHKCIMYMPSAAFDDLPESILADGWRDRYAAERQHREYMRSLSDDEWQVRRAVLLTDRKRRRKSNEAIPELTEESLMAEVRRLLDEYKNPAGEPYPTLLEFVKRNGLYISEREYGLASRDLRCLPMDVLGINRHEDYEREFPC